jgi:hypothetical protein
MSSFSWAVTLAASVALLGLGLLVRGWRGRRVGDHPYCRRCGFDLFGTYPDSTNCSECGADLSAPAKAKAIDLGVRHHRYGLMLMGGMVFLPALLLSYAIGLGALEHLNWEQHKPVWWLTHEAKSRDAQTSDLALHGLLARLNGGKLSNHQTQGLIEEALTIQSQIDRPWSPGWGTLIESAHSAGTLTPEQWKTYAGQGIAGAVGLSMREKFRRGDRMYFRLQGRDARLSRDNALNCWARVEGFVVDGEDLMRQPEQRVDRFWMINGLLPAELLDHLSTGPHAGFMRLRVKATDDSLAMDVPDRLMPLTATLREAQENQKRIEAYLLERWSEMPALADVELKLPLRFEIIPPDQSPLRRVNDESLRTAVEMSLIVDQVRSDGPGDVKVAIGCYNPRMDLSYAVFLRSGQKEWPIGTLVYCQDASPIRPDAFAPDPVLLRAIDAPLAKEVEVIFRPDPRPAAGVPNVFDYWGGEVVIKGSCTDAAGRLERPVATRPVP